jgi:hypothetical protein
MLIELNEAQLTFLRCVLSEELDRNEDHLAFLQSAAAADEEDKELQTAECETAIRHSKALLAELAETRPALACLPKLPWAPEA